MAELSTLLAFLVTLVTVLILFERLKARNLIKC